MALPLADRRDLTQARLKELLSYNPDTGIFTWLPRSVKIPQDKTWNARFSGKVAGSRLGQRIQILIDSKFFYAHRLAWLYVNGVFPTFQIDHKDTIQRHNWIDNLRDVTGAINVENRRYPNANNSSGFLGVHCKAGRWIAQIQVRGQNVHIGSFDTPMDAHEAYKKKKCAVHDGYIQC